MKYAMVKRALDLVITLSISPLWVLLTAGGIVYVVIVSPGNPIYLSRRVGQYGRDINVLKIRTMVPNADEIGSGTTARNDPRFIKGAKFLRSTKIDEMPQFLSVLMGTLSLVGPRPELRQYVDRYTPQDREMILSAKPGIFDYGTLAFSDLQAHLGDGDAEVTFLEKFADQKIALRLQYVAEQGLWTDLKILLKTPAHIASSILVKFR